jgi:uncharacterized peroxidase-related enzyme
MGHGIKIFSHPSSLERMLDMVIGLSRRARAAHHPELSRTGDPGTAPIPAETGRPLSELAEVLLRGPSTLTRGERELIAAYVSGLNDCQYCSSSHSATAAAQLPGGMALVDQVRADADRAPVPAKLRALLAVAAAVQRGGHQVTDEHISNARAADATDLEIHDTVLIAAAFCMMNRYVDGLATIAPDDPAVYAAGAQHLIHEGYVPPAAP